MSETKKERRFALRCDDWSEEDYMRSVQAEFTSDRKKSDSARSAPRGGVRPTTITPITTGVTMNDTCTRCGGIRPSATLTATERTAVANGWTLENYRFAISRLATGKPPDGASQRDQAIPPARDQHADVRALAAARNRPTALGGTHTQVTYTAPLTDSGVIPPTRDQHAAVRALAAGRR
jgi:hypothetical protein